MEEKSLNVVHSLASAKYEAMLLDKGGLGTGPTEEKTIATFQVMDRIIPRLGVFAEIIRLCRNEIFDAVFSGELTGSADCSQDGSQYIQRLPYFLLVNRLKDSYAESENTMKAEMKHIQDAVSAEHEQLLESQTKLEEMEETNQTSTGTIVQLESELEHARNEIKSLQQDLEQLKKTAEETELRLNREITELKINLEQCANEISHLKTFKSNYDKLQNAFQNWNGVEQQSKQRKPEVTATQKSTLVSNVRTCVQLEEQLLTIQNVLIEEFEEFVESITEVRLQFLPKSELSLVDLSNKDEDDDDDTNHRLISMRDKFTKNVGELDAELRKLVRHRRQLQQQLEEIQEADALEKEQIKSQEVLFGASKSIDVGPVISDEPSFNPFVPQERILNKYAVMLYASDNNAKSFYEFRDAVFCPSCHEKTVVCPHTMMNDEHIVTLGPGVTHLKLVRPRIQVRQDLPNETKVEILPETAQDGATSPKTRTLSTAEIYFVRSTDRLWEDYRQRTDLKRSVPRPLSVERTVSIIYQFVDCLLHVDLSCSDDEDRLSILDRLYIFFEDRFIKQSTALLSAHDFLSSVIEHQNSKKLIWIFVHVLIGNLDASVLRYVLLVKDLANGVNWRTVEDFRTFAKIIYPFLGEDDIDALVLGYISFSENRIALDLVADYVIHTIMKYREPRFLEMESLLVSQPGVDPSYMTESEFITAASEQVLTVYDRLQRHLFKEAIAYVTQLDGIHDGVPVLRLAQISSYINLLSSTYQLKRKIRSWQIDPNDPVLF